MTDLADSSLRVGRAREKGSGVPDQVARGGTAPILLALDQKEPISDPIVATLATLNNLIGALSSIAAAGNGDNGNKAAPQPTAQPRRSAFILVLACIIGIAASVATNLAFWTRHEEVGNNAGIAHNTKQDDSIRSLREDVDTINTRLDTQDTELKGLRTDVQALRGDVQAEHAALVSTRTAINDVLDVVEGVADGDKDKDPYGIRQVRRRIKE